VSALASAGGVENLIVLERAKHRAHEVGSVRWAGSTFGPMQKSRLGEHEFEALMRMLDNLGYRTGYTYRYPFVQEKSKPKSDVLIPATVTAFVFEEEGALVPTLRQHAQKQQKEKTRWLNTPNTYMRVNVAEEQQGSASSQKTKTTWLKADDVEKASSGTPIRIENPNQFVPLYTDPQEVLEMRNKIREQNRQDVKSAGPQSQLLASVIADTSRSPVGHPTSLTSIPNPMSCLPSSPPGVSSPSLAPWHPTGRGVTPLRGCFSPQRVTWGTQRPKRHPGRRHPLSQSPRTPSASSPTRSWRSTSRRWRGKSWGYRVGAVQGGAPIPNPPWDQHPPLAVVNGKDEEQSTEENLDKGGGRTTSPANADPDAPKEKETVTSSPVSPEGSPSKSPSKKKKKFRTPSFLKKGKKKEKIES
ncbi:ADDB protein, partial [Uria aalge]|nr:ADDB protein [Uria aalge]